MDREKAKDTLKTLKELYDDNLITYEDYERKKKEVLDILTVNSLLYCCILMVLSKGRRWRFKSIFVL